MESASTPDLYEVLGVARDAAPEDIKRAYRKKASALHPDRNKEEGAGDRLAAVNHAHEVLSDPERRATYDKFGTDEDPIAAAAEETYLKKMAELIDSDANDLVGEMYGWLNSQQDRLQANRSAATADIKRLEKKRKTIRRKSEGKNPVEAIFTRKIDRAKDALKSMDNQELILKAVRAINAQYESVLDHYQPQRASIDHWPVGGGSFLGGLGRRK